MDYKTGSSRPYAGLKDDPIDKGKHLQLAVYSLAARRALGADANVTAAYWFTSSRGGFALAPPEPLDIASEETLGRFQEGVSTIVSGIKSGLFPANPGEPDQGTSATAASATSSRCALPERMLCGGGRRDTRFWEATFNCLREARP